jgi:Uma2 family endonuclease
LAGVNKRARRDHRLGTDYYAVPDPPHGLTIIELAFRFGEIVRPARLGRIFTAPTDVLLLDGGALSPDLSFIRADRLGIVGRTAIEGPET